MQSLFFWKEWTTGYRTLWLVLACIFIFSIAFMWYGYFRGTESVIHWETLQHQKAIDVAVHSFRLGPFTLQVPGESYVIQEYFAGSDVKPNTTASLIFITVLMVSVVILLTVVTTLNRFWYLVGMTLFILVVVSLRLEVLMIFGQRNMIPGAVMLVTFLGLSYYFKSFRPDTRFITRLFSFLLLTLGCAFIIYFFSEVALPLLHLALTGYMVGIVFTILFIFMVAHEIFASFLYIASQGHEKSLRHFGILIVIWFANLIITYLHEIGAIHWNFIYLNLYLLLSISALLGIWGFRQRENQYEDILRFSPFGAYSFLALGITAFGFVGCLLGNANDAALELIRDLIIFSQLGYGLVFLLYVLSNFLALLEKNVPVHRVLYKPNRMPYFTFRLGGLVAVIAFVMYGNWRVSVYHGMAGFYIAAADLYRLQGDDGFAEALYEQASNYDYRNHRSNYSVGMMKAKRFDIERAHERFEAANQRRPSEYSLVNSGNLFIWEDKVFKAIDAYSGANALLPGNGAIQNNLGFAYANVHAVDSAVRYLSRARTQAYSTNSAETNFFAMAAIEFLPIDVDSVAAVFRTTSPGSLGNALALASLQQSKFETPINPLNEKKLTLHSATLLNNYILHHVKHLDTAFTAKAYRIASDSVNADFSEAIKAALAFAYYHQGNVSKALTILAELSYVSSRYQGKYNYIMGLWALEQRNPMLASSFFSYAETQDYKEAKLYHAIALTEAGRRYEAQRAWDSIVASVDTTNHVFARMMKRILALNNTEALTLTDFEKYQFCRYRVGMNDSLLFNRLVNTLADNNYKARALYDRAQKFFEADKLIPAIHCINQVSGMSLTDKELFDNVRFLELEMLASRGEVRTLARQINKGVEFDGSRNLEKLLYAALISESSGDEKTAAKNYEVVGTNNPYFETGILAAANFFRQQDAKSMRAYDLLAEAIQVNSNSIRLLKAYVAEAVRMGFDDYAASAAQRLQEAEAALQ